MNHCSPNNTHHFVTFRTQASIDAFILRLKNSNLDETIKQLSIDQYLAHSNKGRLLNNDIIDLIILFCLNLDPYYYQLCCLSVMPNHVHILFKQKQPVKRIIKKLKCGLAALINKRLHLSGSFWDLEVVDKAINNELQLLTIFNYIKHNANKAGLVDADVRFYGVEDEIS